jgi:hypothetical protein
MQYFQLRSLDPLRIVFPEDMDRGSRGLVCNAALLAAHHALGVTKTLARRLFHFRM